MTPIAMSLSEVPLSEVPPTQIAALWLQATSRGRARGHLLDFGTHLRSARSPFVHSYVS